MTMPDSTAHSTQPGVTGPASATDSPATPQAPASDVPSTGGLLRAILRRLRRREKNEAVREAIEELIEETPESDTPISEDQRVLLANILKLRDKNVADVMVPRVDISAIAADMPLDEVVRLIQAEAHSRYPVYRESLDDVIGMIHIKDVLAYWGTAKKFNLRDILRRVVFVAPTLPVLDMLLDMRRSRTHMALVVDEFGGTDGLLTIEDLVEEIVGEIEDEHDVAQTPTVARRVDGTHRRQRPHAHRAARGGDRPRAVRGRAARDRHGGRPHLLPARAVSPNAARSCAIHRASNSRCSTSIPGASGACACGRRPRRGPPPDPRSVTMTLRGWRAYGAAFLAGALAALAMPPLYWLPLAVLGIVVFVWLWQTAPGPKSALLRGWTWGIGHFAVGSYWIVEAFFVPPADYAALGVPIVAGLAIAARLLPGPCGRRHALAGRALAGAGRAIPSPDPAGDRLDGRRMAARPSLHRLRVESARPCLGFRHAFAAKRRAVRRLWPGHADVPRAGGADRRLAGFDRGAGGAGALQASPARQR